jgi:hypothetical protein
MPVHRNRAAVTCLLRLDFRQRLPTHNLSDLTTRDEHRCSHTDTGLRGGTHVVDPRTAGFEPGLVPVRPTPLPSMYCDSEARWPGDCDGMRLTGAGLVASDGPTRGRTAGAGAGAEASLGRALAAATAAAVPAVTAACSASSSRRLVGAAAAASLPHGMPLRAGALLGGEGIGPPQNKSGSAGGAAVRAGDGTGRCRAAHSISAQERMCMRQKDSIPASSSRIWRRLTASSRVTAAVCDHGLEGLAGLTGAGGSGTGPAARECLPGLRQSSDTSMGNIPP